MTIAELRNWKIVPVIAGIAAVAALTVMLVLAAIAARDADVVARVNGEKITAEDVAELQARYLGYDAQITPDQALEQLITERLLYQEARQKGHALNTKDAEFELHTQLAAMNMTGEDLDVQLQFYGISYEEYLEGYRTELAIQNYLEAAVEVPEVSEEEVEELYDYYRQIVPEEQLPPFDEIKAYLVMKLEQEKHQQAVSDLIERLREQASIKYG